MKELDLTEGRSTGIPTIQNVLENNGSPRASIITDEDRTFFRITIPCHEAAGNIIADIAHKDDSLKASRRGGLKSGPMSGLMNGPIVFKQICDNPHITYSEISKNTGVSRSWVAEIIKRLQTEGYIKRIGNNNTGHWEVVSR